MVNLCENRFRFLVAFAAALQRALTTLMPQAHAPSAIAELAAAHPGCALIDDAGVARAGSAARAAPEPGPADFIAAVGHTSGSTGTPAAHPKPWNSLRTTSALNAAAIRAALPPAARARRAWIVATVPPQHMYGLEMSVLLPLLCGFGIHGGKPLLPADVAAALAEVPAPRILVSTPVHLHALAASAARFPPLALIISATAPLSQELAREAERRFGAVLLEMFGSTETCVVATRRTAQEPRWQPHPGLVMEPAAGGTMVRAPWLASAQLLQDHVELRPDGSFTVIGRHGDLVEVAGKRASLADLTRRLRSIPGVEDAVVFQAPAPAAAAGRVHRCAALVVAPGLAAREVARRFRQMVDPSLVPRPLAVVAALPRNELGKLPLEGLLRLLAAATRAATPD